MSLYRIADGHDVALDNLIALTPQPQSPGIAHTQRTISSTGAVLDQGTYTTWVFKGGMQPLTYQTLLTAMGLSTSATYNDVTIYTTDDTRQWIQMNGRIIKPDARHERFFLRDITFVIRNLIAIVD